MDDQTFQKRADSALEALRDALYDAEENGGFEVDESGGALQITFEEPLAKFVISPNAPVHQIWISALSTSFKLDWSDDLGEFVLHKTGETLKPLMARLISEQTGAPVSLD